MKRPAKSTRDYKLEPDTVGYPLGFSRNDYSKHGPESSCINTTGDFAGRFNSSRSNASAIRDSVRERAFKVIGGE